MRIVLLTSMLALCTPAAAQSIRVSPPSVRLNGPESSQQLLVTAGSGTARRDLTHAVRYDSADPAIAVVTRGGRVRPRREGSTRIRIRHSDTTVSVKVVVTGIVHPRPVSFRHEVVPILSKSGCNSGGCHGKAEGQNGFKLSVFGFDPEADHNEIVKDARGRRVALGRPTSSLLLQKGTAAVPHGGGRKLVPGSVWERVIHRWIREGARLDGAGSVGIASVQVEPESCVLTAGATQQLRVTAIDSRGNRRCVTGEAEYQSNAESVAGSDRNGLVRAGEVPGEAAILIRYMGHVAVCRVTVPQPGPGFTRPKEFNFVDKHVFNKLERLGIPPGTLADDATFLRRVHIDTIGTLPTAAETRAFLADRHPRKRSRLIARLLERDEYADYWAMRWADLLRMDTLRVTPLGTVAATRWLRRQFKENTPYDEWVRAVVTARGHTLAEGPAAFFQIHDKPEHAARSLSQLFLGVRIECAQCHHHPFERWSQRDYFAFAGFFTGVSSKRMPGGGRKIVTKAGANLTHPRTNLPVPAAGLGASPADFGGVGDRREVLARWMTSPENPFFARMIANRIWAHYFGRGLVEPIDDMRTTNPATNEPLLDALAAHLVELKFDLKAFTRTLLNSRVYQQTSRATKRNRLDRSNHSHAVWKAMPAEVLLDAICQLTEVPQEFNGWPKGVRAIQVWDNRMPSFFFRVFGKPQRVSVCECERGTEPSMAQALHLMNSPDVARKIRHRDGRAARLARSALNSEQIIRELYLASLSRPPTRAEIALMQQAFDESTDRRSAIEDILWALMNTREFIYNH